MYSRSEVPILTDVIGREGFQENVYPQRKPVVLRGINIGRASELWTPEYLSARCGQKQVKVHVCEVDQMAFLDKNFLYKTVSFGDLVKRASSERQLDYFLSPNEKYYLRALGEDMRKDIADVSVQFPELIGDIQLPLFFEERKFFSSVLRVGSAGIQLWTHYDIMDNLLVQVRGHKRVVLFPPSDAGYLYLNGDKSEIVDIEQPNLERFPLFRLAHGYECLLQPGDVLFIPALWFHNVRSLEFSVAVNLFWRHLDDEFYDKKDIYGNKDVAPAQRSFQMLDKAIAALKELPEEYRDFYGRRLINTIERKLQLTSPVID